MSAYVVSDFSYTQNISDLILCGIDFFTHYKLQHLFVDIEYYVPTQFISYTKFS